jgi:hypothetical protein
VDTPTPTPTPSSVTTPSSSGSSSKSTTSSPTPKQVQQKPTFSKKVVATSYPTTTINERSKPSATSSVVDTIAPGTPVPLTSVTAKDGWRQTKDGTWVKEENLSSVKPTVAPTAPRTTSEPLPDQDPTQSTRSRTDAPSVPYGVWDKLAQCEASGNWHINTGNGFYGGLQFTLGTWRAFGGTGMPHENSREEQIKVGKRVQAGQGWGAWPACARKLGLL